MMQALIVSNVLLWVAVLSLLVVVIALSRQIGILYERIAPMGALMLDSGPKVGDAAPVFVLPTLDGAELQLGAPAPRSTLLFFPFLASLRPADFGAAPGDFTQPFPQ